MLTVMLLTASGPSCGGLTLKVQPLMQRAKQGGSRSHFGLTRPRTEGSLFLGVFFLLVLEAETKTLHSPHNSDR